MLFFSALFVADRLPSSSRPLGRPSGPDFVPILIFRLTNRRNVLAIRCRLCWGQQSRGSLQDFLLKIALSVLRTHRLESFSAQIALGVLVKHQIHNSLRDILLQLLQGLLHDGRSSYTACWDEDLWRSEDPCPSRI